MQEASLWLGLPCEKTEFSVHAMALLWGTGAGSYIIMTKGRGGVLHWVGICRTFWVSLSACEMVLALCIIAKIRIALCYKLSIYNKKQKLKPYLSKIETKTIVFLCAIMMMHNRLAKGLLI